MLNDTATSDMAVHRMIHRPRLSGVIRSPIAISGIVACLSGILLLALPLQFAFLVFSVALLAYFIVVARRPEILIYFLVFYFSLEILLVAMMPPSWIPLSKVIPEVLLLTGLGLLVVSGRLSTKEWVPRPFTYSLLLVMCAVLLSSVANRASSLDVFYEVRILFRYSLIPFYLLLMPGRPDFLKLLARAILVAVLLQCMIATAQYATHNAFSEFLRPDGDTIEFQNRVFALNRRAETIDQTRLFGTLGNYMNLGSFCALGLCLTLVRVFESQRRRRAAWLLVSLFVTFVLSMTFSRLSILGAVAAVLVVVSLLASWRVRIATFALSGTLIATLYLGGAGIATRWDADASTSIVGRIVGSLSEQHFDTETYSRAFVLFELPYHVLAQKPLLGVGPGPDALTSLSLPDTRFPVYLFDAGYVNLLTRFGIIGLLCFVTPLLVLIRTSVLRARNPGLEAHRGFFAAFAAYLGACLVFCLFTSPFYARYISFYFWVLLGAFFIAERESASAHLQDSTGASA